MWFNLSARRRHPAPAHRRPPARRPRAEALEPRSLLSGAGSLDPSFGSGGIVTTSPTRGNDYGNGVLLQTNGDLIAYGVGYQVKGKSGSVLVRYTPSGGLDTTFGSGGIVSNGLDGIGGAALQSDGKILAYGSGHLVRYSSNGSLDTTFGSKGMATFPSGFGASGAPGEIIIQPTNGDIVVGGSVGYPYTFALLRYTLNGTLDPTFGNGGEVVTSIPGNNADLNCVAWENGEIVGAGSENNQVWALARYTASGSLDTTFGPGGTGIVTTAIGYNGTSGAAINSLVVQSDGKIMAVGDAEDPNSPALPEEWALARYDALGNLDRTFGSGGIVTSSFTTGGDTVGAAALQSNGQIVVAGVCNADSGTPQFEVGRYNTDGSLDNGFGSGGVTTTASGSGAKAVGLVIQTDGNIVAAGFADISGKDDFMLARYLGTATTTAAAPRRSGAEPVPSTPHETSIGALTDAAAAASPGIGPADPPLFAPPGLATWWRPKARAVIS
jgi:uncharacterized delta-60 repeat protein